VAARDVSVLDKINQFLELGLGSFVIAKTDRGVTEGAEKIFTLYKLADSLQVLLLATRTGEFNTEVTQ